MRNIRRSLFATTALVGASLATPAFAQDAPQPPAQPVEPTQVQEPVVGQPAAAVDETAPAGEIVVTGSRIVRPNLESNSPIAVVTGEEVVENADITLETFLNTLPQANPAGTTTSNNPPNGGQANINLRGLGSNRNLVLIDGRRPMVSNLGQTVDLNTIPQGLIERIEIVTGGAGATYGADAIAGVVNIIMKDDFDGLELRGTYANTIPELDAMEYQVSATFGGNFNDNRGNLAFGVEYANREALFKSQRAFASQATSTTPTPPVGRLLESAANPFSQAALTALFTSYGVPADQIPILGGSQLHFNADQTISTPGSFNNTLFGGGIFNSPIDVSNFGYPLNSPTAAPNLNYFPDFYSYNFDFVNYLVLPLKRKSAFLKGDYEFSPAVNVFTQAGWTEYTATQALAPTPLGVRIYNPGFVPGQQFASSALVAPIANNFVSGAVIPVTNPFIPADLATLLASRTGDNPQLTGSGATEPINLSIRTLSVGLREATNNNQVIQGLIGARGDITDNWRYEAYVSWGRTTLDSANAGNVNVNKLQQLLEAPDGGDALCEGGYNPFGIQVISQDCVEFINETGFTNTTFTQRIAQAYVQGDIYELPGGSLSVVLGAESRKFNFDFDPGALFGPIAGFNTATPAGGGNKFTDIFAEALFPIAKNAPWAESLEVSLGYRSSWYKFIDRFHDFNPFDTDTATHLFTSDTVRSDAYKADVSWAPIRDLRLRASYQRAVRAPNFGELFFNGSSFPQIFDPCSATSNFRQTSGAAGLALCAAGNSLFGSAGIPASSLPTFQQNPNSQAALGLGGNTNLEPEKADTFTVGGVFNRWGFIGSVDYYNINIKKPIFGPDPNYFIAACFGYLGNFNPDLDPDNPYCQSIVRGGGQISFLVAPPAIGGDATYNFTLQNFGKVKTSGIDFQLGYRLPTDFLLPSSSLNMSAYVNYLIDFKVEQLPGVVQDYAGTVSYFGAGLGTSFPRWRGLFNAAWTFKPITLSTRIRYINKMKNRAELQFPTEPQFSRDEARTPTVWYFDFAAEANIDNYTLRLGLNNAFDKDPPVYNPNVQSGTDPSLFDVIGRRAYVQATVKF